MEDVETTYKDRISQDRPMVGKPVVRAPGFRWSWCWATLPTTPPGRPVRRLPAPHPHPTFEDVKACLAYAQAVVAAPSRKAGTAATGYEVSAGKSADARLVPSLVARCHEVTHVAKDYPADLPDTEVSAPAHRERRILVANDRDFGELVFKHRQPTPASFSSGLAPTPAGHQNRPARLRPHHYH